VRIKRPPKKRNRISLTPLIDVVFLLLVFFMLASTFWRYSGFDLSGGRSGVAQDTNLSDLVIVRLKGSTSIDVNGKPVALNQLTDELVSLAGKNKVKVAVKIMGESKTQDLVSVIEKMKTSAVREVMLIK
jgi:biopolymer transport protein ExbD